jgi:hypothetical protein
LVKAYPGRLKAPPFTICPTSIWLEASFASMRDPRAVLAKVIGALNPLPDAEHLE